MTSADVRARLVHALRLDLVGPEPGEAQSAEILAVPPAGTRAVSVFLVNRRRPLEAQDELKDRTFAFQAALTVQAGDSMVFQKTKSELRYLRFSVVKETGGCR